MVIKKKVLIVQKDWLLSEFTFASTSYFVHNSYLWSLPFFIYRLRDGGDFMSINITRWLVKQMLLLLFWNNVYPLNLSRLIIIWSLCKTWIPCNSDSKISCSSFLKKIIMCCSIWLVCTTVLRGLECR